MTGLASRWRALPIRPALAAMDRKRACEPVKRSPGTRWISGPQDHKPVPDSRPAGNEAQSSESALRAALVQNPRSFEANHNLGEFYLRAARYREAIPLLQAAYQVNPGEYPNAFDLALAFKGAGELAPAREQVKRLLASEKGRVKADQADLHRLLGDLDEKLDDPLSAVREYEHATGLVASERIILRGEPNSSFTKRLLRLTDVFGRRRSPASRTRPDCWPGWERRSTRAVLLMRRRSACAKPPSHPANPAPYLFLGRMQEATSTSLACAEEKLARFVHDQPANARANYYYALALWRRDRGLEDSETLQHAEAFLYQSVGDRPQVRPAVFATRQFVFFAGRFAECDHRLPERSRDEPCRQ